MGFTKKDNIYRITRMTRNQDSFLGLSFATNNEKNIKVIELYVNNPKKKKIQPSKDEVLKLEISTTDRIELSCDSLLYAQLLRKSRKHNEFKQFRLLKNKEIKEAKNKKLVKSYLQLTRSSKKS